MLSQAERRALVIKLRYELKLSLYDIRLAVADIAEGWNDDRAGFEEAVRLLLATRAQRKASEKVARALKAGTVGVYLHSNHQIAAMVKLACETDFVAKNEEFRMLAKDLAMQVCALQPKDLFELEHQTFIKADTFGAIGTVEQRVQQAIAKFGENISIETFTYFKVESCGP